mmetsp:Transcript_55/g.133  ORF Transcript_55/g.133 Transcript_55/m.133 type:complete len:302 (+) Transcript_55:147-1052(+)
MGGMSALYKESVKLKMTNNLYEASDLGKEYLEMARRVYGEDHPDVANGLMNLADIRHKLGEHREAIKLYNESLSVRERLQGEGRLEKCEVLQKLGIVYDSLGEPEEGVACLERAIALDPTDQEVAGCLNTLAVIHMNSKQYDLALPLLEKSLALREKEFGMKHPHVATALTNLGAVFEKQGKFDAAQPLFERALCIREDVFGPDHSQTRQARGNLDDLLEKCRMDADFARQISSIERRAADFALEQKLKVEKEQIDQLERMKAQKESQQTGGRARGGRARIESIKKIPTMAAARLGRSVAA